MADLESGGVESPCDSPMFSNAERVHYEQVYDSIKQMIIKGTWARGETVCEAKIARQFEVSRSPARESIRALEKEGLVVLDEKCGLRCTSRICRISRKFIKASDANSKLQPNLAPRFLRMMTIKR
ncbi:winged helix-turn-helix domain-containing protein [Paenibacillus piri]|uniref:GntR family transcriptional regulator n=1 Tax=Paenibacillus piri TaxID=2547395 RepID=A0A4R5KHD1_9BACL|nr:GntR family transcriptional regulator [Paenibacillus piri]